MYPITYFIIEEIQERGGVHIEVWGYLFDAGRRRLLSILFLVLSFPRDIILTMTKTLSFTGLILLRPSRPHPPCLMLSPTEVLVLVSFILYLGLIGSLTPTKETVLTFHIHIIGDGEMCISFLLLSPLVNSCVTSALPFPTAMYTSPMTAQAVWRS